MTPRRFVSLWIFIQIEVCLHRFEPVDDVIQWRLRDVDVTATCWLHCLCKTAARAFACLLGGIEPAVSHSRGHRSLLMTSDSRWLDHNTRATQRGDPPNEIENLTSQQGRRAPATSNRRSSNADTAAGGRGVYQLFQRQQPAADLVERLVARLAVPWLKMVKWKNRQVTPSLCRRVVFSKCWQLYTTFRLLLILLLKMTYLILTKLLLNVVIK